MPGASFSHNLMDHNRPQDMAIAHAYATKAELEALIHSKDHFEQLFAIKGRKYLPPKKYRTWKFFRQILDGSKELLDLSQVNSLYVPPKVGELTVKHLWEQVKTDERFTKYFPDTTRPIDREYFFAILSSVLPDFYETALKAIKDDRRAGIMDEEKIAVTEEMRELITANVPYFGQKRKVGQFLNVGRRWTTPVRQQKQTIDLRQLF